MTTQSHNSVTCENTSLALRPTSPQTRPGRSRPFAPPPYRGAKGEGRDQASPSPHEKDPGMTTTTTTTEPSVREILAAGKCSPSCILSSLEPERCGCRRCGGQYHGAALAALGLLSQPGTGSKPRTRRKHQRKKHR